MCVCVVCARVSVCVWVGTTERKRERGKRSTRTGPLRYIYWVSGVGVSPKHKTQSHRSQTK